MKNPTLYLVIFTWLWKLQECFFEKKGIWTPEETGTNTDGITALVLVSFQEDLGHQTLTC